MFFLPASKRGTSVCEESHDRSPSAQGIFLLYTGGKLSKTSHLSVNLGFRFGHIFPWAALSWSWTPKKSSSWESPVLEEHKNRDCGGFSAQNQSGDRFYCGSVKGRGDTLTTQSIQQDLLPRGDRLHICDSTAGKPMLITIKTFPIIVNLQSQKQTSSNVSLFGSWALLVVTFPNWLKQKKKKSPRGYEASMVFKLANC